MRHLVRITSVQVALWLLALVPHSIARADTVFHFTQPYVFSNDDPA